MRMADRTYANTDCPYCSAALDPLPRAKKRCPTCGEPVYVRAGPDGLTYLLRDADRPVLDAAWDEHHEAEARADAKARMLALGPQMVEQLRDLRRLGVARVEVLRSDDGCRACRAAAAVYPIAGAPKIPIPGCTSEICRCDYAPVI